MAEYRGWMYEGRIVNGLVSMEWLQRVEREFITFALQHPECIDGNKLKCPCMLRKCQNKRFYPVDTVLTHLGKHRFMANYEIWIFHGEDILYTEEVGNVTHDVSGELYENMGGYQRMVMDAAGPEFMPQSNPSVSDEY